MVFLLVVKQATESFLWKLGFFHYWKPKLIATMDFYNNVVSSFKSLTSLAFTCFCWWVLYISLPVFPYL